jgi:Domain of unknown function (DUF4249)
MKPFLNTGPHSIRISVRLIYLLLLGGCLTPIDFSTERIGGTLVATGQISTIQEQNIIQLGLTADTERLPVPLSGAYIVLSDDQNQSISYYEDLNNPGTYILPDIQGVPGRTYTITITSPDGAVYESVPERMPELSGQLATHFEFVQEEYTDAEGIVSPEWFIKLYTNSQLPVTEVPAYLKWSVEEAFLLTPTDFPDPFGYIPPPCFVVQNADPQRISLFDGVKLNTTSIENLLVGSRVIDWTFQEKHYFTTYQTSLTKEAYEYWRKVNILANQVGSIFDTPPATITGNIRNPNKPSEKVFGYFQAVNQTYDRVVIFQDDLPFRLLTSTCTFDEQVYEYPQRCLDCTSIRNSSNNRPDWF